MSLFESLTSHKNGLHILRDRSGNFGMMSALLLPLLLVSAGGAVDLSHVLSEKQRLQGLVDSAALVAAKETGDQAQWNAARQMMAKASEEPIDFQTLLAVAQNTDGSVTTDYTGQVATPFLGMIGLRKLDISVTATAISSKGSTAGGKGCIYVLGSKGQDVLINSGANIQSAACEAHVQSKAAPAFIMNSGSKIETAKFCVRGTNYIKNGGTLSNLSVGCSAEDDPYSAGLPEPSVPSTCTTSGWYNTNNVTMKTGMHCETGFNGSSTITFEPGLHIIKGRMIINSNATVIAEGVTFYFPDVYSEIRINGGVKFTGTAPTTGTYKGILMFENTSNAANAANKQQYIFNGSKGELLEGIIHLPNRDVTYNSTTNQVNRITLVVNTMIVNSANWLMEPFNPSGSGSGATAAVRLIN